MEYVYFKLGDNLIFIKRLNYIVDGFFLSKSGSYGSEGIYESDSYHDEYCIDLSTYNNQYGDINKMLEKLKIKDREDFINNLIK